MAPLTAFFLCSLDLRLTDTGGDFSWAEPPEDVHALANDRAREVGTHLYGRRMWETMRFWQTVPDDDSVMGDFGRVWRAADKVVFSRTLEGIEAPRTRLERVFDAETVGALKRASTRPLTVSGPELAGQALRAGLVDELELVLVPVVIGSGPRVLPDHVRLGLELVEQRAFPSGWVDLRYRVAAAA